MNIKNLTLFSSNESKLKEFQRYGLKDLVCKKGKDICEVQSDDITIAIYKAKEVGEYSIIEDTSLHIENADIGANIKWELNNLPHYVGCQAVWSVLLAVNVNGCIYVYQGVQEGTIGNQYTIPPKDAFGFDPYFIPKDTSENLYDLDKKKRKIIILLDVSQ